MSKPLYILDGYALIYKSYYSMGKQAPLRNSKEENITAIVVFFRSLFSLIKNFDIEHFVVALDPIEPTFRRKRYPEYKAHRPAPPDELRSQSDHIERILTECGFITLRIGDNEADDIIASLAWQRHQTGLATVIISGDKDLMQLLNEEITMLRFTTKREFKAGVEPMSASDVLPKMGVPPHQIHDYLAILGDASDNIPGVAGIGEKGAIKLLEKHHSLKRIYDEINHVTPAGTRDKLIRAKEMAFLSWELVDLKRDIDLPSINIEAFHLASVHFSRLHQALEALGIKQILSDIPPIASRFQHQLELNSQPDSQPQKLPLTYALITTIPELINLFKEIEQAGIVAYDSETTGLNPRQDQIVGMSFSLDGKHGYYIPFSAPKGEATLAFDEALPHLKKLFASGVKFIGQNLKFDMQFLFPLDIILTPYFDTMIAAWLIDSQSPVNLDTLAKRYLNHQTIHYSDIVAKNQRFDEVSLTLSTEYACEDASLAFALYQLFRPQMESLQLDRLFFDLEMPLVSILARMEWRGIELDAQALRDYGQQLERQSKELEAQIIDLVGHSFNVQSPKQLAQVLFEELGFTDLKKGSTDVHILRELQRLHPEDLLIPAVLEYRKVAKLKSTYVEGLLKEITPENAIHTSFLQSGTASGRLSSINPNLQNIPIKNEEGRKIRQAFQSREGYQLISADYSQIELVVLAHLAQDPIMLETFANGRDLHRETASFLFQLPQEQVSSEQRRIGKTINFGVIYGMSAFRLSNELKIPRALATKFIDSYFARYAKVREFVQKSVAYANEHGEVRTVLQRRRLIHQINSKNHNERLASERIALNTVIQGSAADIVKLAMLRVNTLLQEYQLNAHLLLQVHDELILEVHHDHLDIAKTLLTQAMQEAGKSLPAPIPLTINLESGKKWGEFH